MYKYQKAYLERLKRKLLNYYGNKCCVCGSTENLEFAHKQPTKLSGIGRGKSKRLIDVKNNLDKYALTCHNHNKNVEGKA